MNVVSKIILYFFIICQVFSSLISAQSTPFQKLYFFSPFIPSSNKFIHTNFYGMEALSDGGYATLGFVTDTNNISQGFLARFDCLGNVLWTKLLGASGSPTNTVMGISETDSSDLVFSFPLGTGFFQASTLLGRVDKDGKTKWLKRIGNNTEFGRDIVRTKDGGFVMAGSSGFYGTDNSADDIYLMKIDSLGNIQWSKTFGNPGGTYDEAFELAVDSKSNLIVTGRCIADGTFQAFILKADSLGNPIKFKTYGFNNQRTNAFGIVVDEFDNYLITGFTTILELDHSSSEADVFLIKVDSALNTIFTNIYEVNVGRDFSTLGESITIGPDGKYVIGVSTLSFSNHDASGPSSPGKNALYIINTDGTIHQAMLYNMKGSQYTRVARTMDGFYVCGFSTAYANNVNFQGIIIKTDNKYISGCHDIDVTPELSLYQEPWTVADYTYQTKGGHRFVNYINVQDTNLQVRVECETKIELNPDIEGPTMACIGDKIKIKDLSTGTDGSKHIWLINGQPAGEGKMDIEVEINKPGTITITKVMSYACISRQDQITVEVPNTIREINAEICKGQSYLFFNRTIKESGIYLENVKSSPCDSTIILNLKIDTNLIVENKIVDNKPQFCNEPIIYSGKTYTNSGLHFLTKDTIFNECKVVNSLLNIEDLNCCLRFPNVVTPGDQVDNKVFRPIFPDSCQANYTSVEFKIFNRWGQVVYESNNSNQLSWDCNYKGEPAPMDTYSYLFEYSLIFQNELRKLKEKGMFTIIR